jgi:predicted house-cleaning noncanonical NTP pyrophosphatase (MazG superfamily)
MNKFRSNNIRIFVANKLVRDATAQRLNQRGITAHTHVLTTEEYDKELRSKLVEEADEVVHTASPKELTTELADVLEVIHALCALHNISIEDVEQARCTAKEARGGFDQHVYISQFEMAADNEAINYYLNQPHKYPEV